MSIDSNALIAKIAAERMGVPAPAAPATASPAVAADPAAAAKLAPPQPAAPQPNPASGAAPDKSTPQDAANTAGAPKDEGARMAEDAIMYEVEFGPGQKRKLTPKQISETFSRYRDLNFEHANLKPVLEVAKQLMKQSGMDPKKFAETMSAIAKAQESNPTMGNQQAAKGNSNAPNATRDSSASDDDGDDLAKWEKENASTLPPGYRDMMKGNTSIKSQLDQVTQMLQQVLAGSAGVADAARVAQQDARGTQVNAIRQTIANNLDAVQQHLGLGDDAAQDFMTFAGERGYTMEDFIDPQLTLKVMSDFKATASSPEMERLRQIAQRRQAFTGSIGQGAASGQGTAPPPPPSRLNQLTELAMTQRGMK